MRYNFDPYAEVSWLENYQAIHVQWRNLYMSLDQFRVICQQAAQILTENKASIWIANQYESEGVFNKEIQEFIELDLYEAAQQIGIKSILTVMPKEAGLSSLSTKRWVNKAVSRDDFFTETFATLDDCFAWIKDSTLTP